MFRTMLQTKILVQLLREAGHPYAVLWMETHGLLKNPEVSAADFAGAPTQVLDAVEPHVGRVPAHRSGLRCKHCHNERLVNRHGGAGWCRRCGGYVRLEPVPSEELAGSANLLCAV